MKKLRKKENKKTYLEAKKTQKAKTKRESLKISKNSSRLIFPKDALVHK
ncbi:MAG: hypothetical protein LBI77_00010 [Puniceicoccales bacterium]|jgi:hypothetical protein|nr:hypothetical protein [Puniceicoccales bacterium]